MTLRYYLALSTVGLLSYIIVSFFQSYPGYMDADYYFAGGLQLFDGSGFMEPFIWNYLGNPTKIPQPSHTYWMPLASILSAFGLFLFGVRNFTAARLPFILIALLVPPMTAYLVSTFESQNAHPWKGLFAGCLAAFPGFYLPFITTTDTFGIYMVLGALFFLLISRKKQSSMTFVVLGIVTGFMHLARSDGILWLGIGITVAIFQGKGVTLKQKKFQRWRDLLPALLLFCGYIFVMIPWYTRNLVVFGTLFAPGVSRVLWMTEYNYLYSFPADKLTFQRWIQSGVKEILFARIDALGQNLTSAVVVQWGILLAPLVLLGLWSLRYDLRVKVGILAWLAILFEMSIVFPFIGIRGGMFHSAAALQPLFWGMAPFGLERFISWGEKHRNWHKKEAHFVFSVGIILIIVMLSGVSVYQKVIGFGANKPIWGQSEIRYSLVEEYLAGLTKTKMEIVMVNNPPGYYVVSSRPAIAIPSGGIEDSLAVAKKYNAKYMLLEANHPSGLNQIYQNPTDVVGLRYLRTIEGVHIFEIVLDH